MAVDTGKKAALSGRRLGCLTDLQVFITDQCNAPKICELTNVSSVEWNRLIDDISTAEITVAISDPECCECMATIEPWCHILHIIRNGEIVWQGPVTSITYGYEGVKIHAEDILAFLKVTVPQAKLDNTKLFPATATSKGGQEITDLAIEVIDTGFADRNPCFVKNIIQTDITNSQRPTMFAHTSVSADVGFHAYDGTVFDWLQILAQNGLDYTVLGLTIVLGVENSNTLRLGTLTDDNILGEIEVTKDGYLMSNRVFVRYPDDDKDATCAANCKAGNKNVDCKTCAATGFTQPCYSTPCPAISEASNKYCYGPIERLFNNGEVGNYTTAKQTADAYVTAGSKAPRILSFPNGTKLSPDTPWAINEMIPGQRIDVALTGICLDTFQSFRLQEVHYVLQSGGDEEVSITLSEFNSIGSL